MGRVKKSEGADVYHISRLLLSWVAGARAESLVQEDT